MSIYLCGINYDVIYNIRLDTDGRKRARWSGGALGILVMTKFLTYIFENKEWLFSGIGVFAIGAIFTILRIMTNRRSRSLNNTKFIENLPKENIDKENKVQRNIVEYISNIPIDPNITSDEISILTYFCKFARGQHTQGYRLDWIYNELLSTIPAGTLYLYLENLFSKGYLAKYISERGSI